tara:strand:+ start:807 stop:1076 length:270 start_codon:yes stop_codon:yes gene_type:complete
VGYGLGERAKVAEREAPVLGEEQSLGCSLMSRRWLMALDEHNSFCHGLPATTTVVQWSGAHEWKVGGERRRGTQILSDRVPSSGFTGIN